MFARQQQQLQTHLQAKMESQDARNGWQRRSIAKQTIEFVESDLQHVLTQSPFLQRSQAGEHIAVFHRSEIVAGNRLGKGGFSDVFEVAGFNLNPFYGQQLDPQQQQLRLQYQHSVATGQGRFAIKYLQERLLGNSKNFQCAASDLAVEAAYMSSLNHENILPVRGLPIDGLHAFGDGRHDGYFIILDRLEETLDDRLKQWKVQDAPLQEKLGYALQLASALQYLHERGIVYRDLKPHNVGFNARGQLQLLDFGLCRELPEGNSESLFEMSGVGTRRYMAVEIINTAQYNHKADVYAWSMVLWEMLYLDRPFPHYSIEEHKMMVCEVGERPPLPHSWPTEIRKLLGQTWTASIKHRLSMCDAAAALRTYMNALKSPEVPESPVAVYDRTLLQMDDSFMHQNCLPVTPVLHSTLPTAEDLVRDHRMSVVSCNAQQLQPQNQFPIHVQQPHHHHSHSYDNYNTNMMFDTSVGVEVVSDNYHQHYLHQQQVQEQQHVPLRNSFGGMTSCHLSF